MVEYWRLGACVYHLEVIAGSQTEAGNMLKNDACGDCERSGLLTLRQSQVAQAAGIFRQVRKILDEDPGADIVIRNLRNINSVN